MMPSDIMAHSVARQANFLECYIRCGHREVTDSTPKPLLRTLRARSQARMKTSFAKGEKREARMIRENKRCKYRVGFLNLSTSGASSYADRTSVRNFRTASDRAER